MREDRDIRKAVVEDITQVMSILDAARETMRRSGNMLQWASGYPSEDTIMADISAHNGYVVEQGDTLIAYFAWIQSPEHTYNAIEDGEWLDDGESYHVIHRIGGIPTARGVFDDILGYCLERDSHIRIDTHADNHIMQHLLESRGFTRRGIIHLDDGSPRLAYQLIR